VSHSGKEAQDILLSVADRVQLKNYRQQPVVMSRGQGVELWDVAGNRYLDMTAGISVCSLGHSHPELTRTIAEQASRLLHVSNLYFIEQQIRAAEAIVERCFASRVFFCNSGAEANEGALKLARRYQHVIRERPERNTFVSTLGSFHGRSMATVSVTGQEKYRQGFGPLIEDVEFIPFGDLAAAEKALLNEEACAFIVEPIQAEGGILVPPEGYLEGLRNLCDKTDTLLIFDEVQTGVGRTGTWFAHQQEGVEPDVMTLAKALGGGVPIGAVAASEKAAEGLSFREGGAVPHASTFGGNALACASAIAVFDVIEREGLLENCMQAGQYLERRLEELSRVYTGLCEGPRGRGLLRGLALKEPAGPIVTECRQRGLLLSVAGGTVVRFAPALGVRRAHLDEAVGILEHVLAAHESG
jgi:predicted acetylornithine/succinylornithine family transaminase